jgi:hypothetical protein
MTDDWAIEGLTNQERDDFMAALTEQHSAENDVLSAEERAILLRVLDWGVESRNMTHEMALRVLTIVDRTRVIPPGGDQS